MRGKFNTSADLYGGVNSVNPGGLIGTFPCRLVLEDAIDTAGAGAPIIRRYLTIDQYEPVGAWTIPFFGLDPQNSDLVAVPAGTLPRWWVLYTDVIHWYALTPYWRAYLVELPLPPTYEPGGVEVGGRALYNSTVLYTGFGGVEVGGSADRMVATFYTGSGGAEVGGGAVYAPHFTIVGSGGSKVGGYAVYVPQNPYTGSGGVEVGGGAVYAGYYTYTGSGGVEVGGGAVYAFNSGLPISLGEAHSSPGSNVHSLTYSISPSAGLLIVGVALFGEGSAPASVTYGGTAMTLDASKKDSGAGVLWVLCYSLAVSGGTGNVVITLVASDLAPIASQAVLVQGLSGNAADQTAAASGSSTSPASGSTGTTGHASEVAISFGNLQSFGGSVTITWGGSFTTTAQDSHSAGVVDNYLIGAYRVLSSTTTVNGSASLSGSCAWEQLVVTYF